MTDLIAVRVRECPDGTHPEGDHVYILPKLSLEGGIAARQDLREAGLSHPVTAADFDATANPITAAGRAYDAALIRAWMVTFCRYGAVSWDLHDEGGPVWPFDVDRLLADSELGFVVADTADDHYRSAVIRPLAARASRTSPPGPTDASTSAPTTSTGTPPEPSSAPATDGTLSLVPTA